MATKMQLRPGTGGSFGFTAGGMRASASVNFVPYLMPWAMAVAMAVLAVVIRLVMAADSQAWFWSTAVAAVYIGLTVITWKASRPRGTLTCVLATGGVAAGSVWSWLVAGMPAPGWRPFALYGLLAVLVCAGANIYTAFKRGNTEGDGGMLGQLGGAVAKLRSINEIAIKDGQVEASYKMEPGVSATALQTDTATLASLYELPPDGVQVVPSKDNASAGTLRLSPTNPLENPPVWPGPSKPRGGSVMDPCVVGVRRGGQPLQFWLPGDRKAGRNASLVQVTGMTGAGKTEAIRMLLVELLSRGTPAEVEYWYGNSRKAAQEPAWVERGAARFASTRKDVAQLLVDLREECPKRSAHLGALGLDEWEPGCGLALRLVVLDEFADIAKDVEKIVVHVAETVRSLGIIIVFGMQRASHTRMPTDLRSMLGTSWCFGVKDGDDAMMALPEEVLEAGARPELWGNKVPGMCYLSAPGVDEELWPQTARTFRPNRDLMAKWAEHYIGLRERGLGAGSPLPFVTATTSAGPAGAAAAPVVPVAARVVHRDQSNHSEGVGGELELLDTEMSTDVDGDGPSLADFEVDVPTGDPGEDEFDDVEDLDEGEVADEVAELLQSVTDELDGEDGADLDGFDDDLPRVQVPGDVSMELGDTSVRTPIVLGAETGGMRLGLSPQMPPEQARAHVRRWFAQMYNSGRTLVKREDMGEVLGEVGYRFGWLNKVLGEFVDQQPAWLCRSESRGYYEITADPDPSLGEIEAAK